MPRPLILLLAILFLAKPSLADEKAKPSPVAKKILDEAVGEVKKNLKAFEKANEKPIAEARDKFQELAKKLIGDGKTDEATAVLGQVKTLEADVMKMAKAPEPSGGGGKPAPQKPLLERMVGKWRRIDPQQEYFVAADGMIRAQNGDAGKLTSTSPESAEVVFRSGWKFQIIMVNDELACCLAWKPTGERTHGFALERN